MGTFMAQCPSVPVIRGSEVRFSVETSKIQPIFDWPLAYVSCGEIIPGQPRVQWGVPADGARYDSFSGFRLGDARTNLTLGSRTSHVGTSSRIGTVERQKVGVATLTLGGMVRFKYWNDHAFWWWPIGDGGDQGDTAGLQFGYNLGAHDIRAGDWKFQELNLTMRLASGIPKRDSARRMGDGFVYSEVAFKGVDRGDIDLSTSLTNRRQERLEIGVLVNSGSLRHGVQSDVVHRTLGIPEFPRTTHVETMVYLRWTGW